MAETQRVRLNRIKKELADLANKNGVTVGDVREGVYRLNKKGEIKDVYALTNRYYCHTKLQWLPFRELKDLF
jgi:DNA-binding Lrp family transcriptional regulator